MNCPYENHDGPTCHKDFCECVKASMKDYKKISRDRKVTASINFFTKNKIPYTETGVDNIVTTEYWGVKYYVSLKKFTFRKEHTSNWVEKNKKMFKLDSTLSFGKYKGKKIKDVINEDKKYINWLISDTGYLFDLDVHKVLV